MNLNLQIFSWDIDQREIFQFLNADRFEHEIGLSH